LAGTYIISNICATWNYFCKIIYNAIIERINSKMQELLIDVTNKQKNILLLENGKLTERYIEEEGQERLEGNIYLGIVENVLPGMQAAFVDIGKEKNTFIHIRDILPKVSNETG